LHSILQLPEVLVAVGVLSGKAKASATTDSDLDRATQILESIQRGGNEHLASLAIRAELQQRTGKHGGAFKTLSKLQSLVSLEEDTQNQASTFSLSMAIAKTLWYMGNVCEAEKVCVQLLDIDHVQDLPLQYASALTGYGLSKLVQCDSLDDAFTVRDPLRMAVKYLERFPGQYGLPLIAAKLNLGVAEVLFGNVVSENRDLKVPIDPALKTWTQAMTVLDGRSPSTPSEKAIVAALQVRLEGNLAWGVLKINDDMEDIVPLASGYAGNALRVLDEITEIENGEKEFLRRILTVVGTCYHKGGKAVTAEGLLKSAISLPSIGCTLTKLDEKSAYSSLCDLYKEWDKREGDADNFDSKARQLELTLPDQWQGKKEILSSLWFWTPEEFSY